VPVSCRHLFVRGRVQGVGFRWHTRAEAQALGLAGWVRNLPDGRVEAWVEGEEAALERFLVWIRRGPPAARVDALECVVAPVTGCVDFETRR
jgi:acylphosphatase